LSPSLSETFATALSSRGLSDATVRAYCSDLTEFIEWAGENPTSASFDLLVTDWLNIGRRGTPGHRDGKPWAPKTTGRRVTSMRTFARTMGWPTPALSVYRAPMPARPVPHPLTDGVSAVRKMLTFCDSNRHRALVALCALGGLRCNEARTLPPGGVDPLEMTITVMGKGSRQRVIPMSDDLWLCIHLAWSTAQATGAPSIVGLSDRQARQAITDIAKRAGISQHVSSHDLRATFATAVYNNSGRDIRATQELLGHSSTKQTEVYVDVPMTRLREAASIF
jgi:site-specific recombinase XerD